MLKIKKIFFNHNMAIGIILLFFSTVVYRQTNPLPYQVAIFPKVCLAIIGLMGIIAILQSILANHRGAEKSIFRKEVAIATLALFFCHVLMSYIGFYVTTSIFIFFMFLYTEKSWNVKFFLKGGIFSIIATVILYAMFSWLMHLMPPEGLFI